MSTQGTFGLVINNNGESKEDRKERITQAKKDLKRLRERKKYFIKEGQFTKERQETFNEFEQMYLRLSK